jgi:hypothetical protein
MLEQQHAAGLWEPYQIEGTPDADVLRWGAATFGHLYGLFRSAAAGPAGVAYATAHSLYTRGHGVPADPAWRGIVHNFRELDLKELERMGHRGLAGGRAFETLVADQVRASAVCARHVSNPTLQLVVAHRACASARSPVLQSAHRVVSHHDRSSLGAHRAT